MTAERERMEITEFLAPGVSSLTLLTNLRALSEELNSGSGRRAIARMADRVESGVPVEEAFLEVQSQLPAGMRHWCQIGLAHQRLDLLLTMYMEHIRHRSDLRRSAWVSLIYPVSLVSVAGVMGLGMAVMIVPMFEAIYSDFGTQLPGVTEVLIELSRLVRHYALWVFAAVVLASLLLRGLSRPLGLERFLQFLFRSIPGFGGVFRWSSLAACSELLAMLIEIEVPLPAALRAAAETTDDLSLASGLSEAADDVEAGRSLSPSIRSQPVYSLPVELAIAFQSASRPALLASLLHSYSQIFTARSRVDLHLVRWAMEPFVLLFVAIAIGFSFLSLFLPLIKLLNDLS